VCLAVAFGTTAAAMAAGVSSEPRTAHWSRVMPLSWHRLCSGRPAGALVSVLDWAYWSPGS
jgi:hypothetical protein